jgi:glycerophosphoryl diester phosphodiesterase
MKKLLFTITILLAGTAIKAQHKGKDKNAPFPVFDREAHRGGRGIMPENTIPAMLNAVDMGVESLEMDTHITADDQVILSHDEYINNLFSLTADGKELTKEEGMKYAFYKMPYAEIAKFDVGTRYYSKYPQQKKMKVGIPLLADLIDSVQYHIKTTGKRQVFYNIETKSSEKADGIYNPKPEKFVKLLMDVIIKKGISSWVVIQSFDKRTLQIIHKKYPDVRTSYLVEGKKDLATDIAELGFTPFIYSPYYKSVNAAMVSDCHAKNIKVLPWTIDTAEEIAATKALGVDGIITDYPGLLMQ